MAVKQIYRYYNVGVSRRDTNNDSQTSSPSSISHLGVEYAWTWEIVPHRAEPSGKRCNERGGEPIILRQFIFASGLSQNQPSSQCGSISADQFLDTQAGHRAREG